MRIGFDGSRAFVSEATGTENYSLNLLKSLAEIEHKKENNNDRINKFFINIQ